MVKIELAFGFSDACVSVYSRSQAGVHKSIQ